ncbi:MAG: hypothetical protein QNJ42_13125 [Crocosphaera sp.]|nr:hypothetical protein [Crocosphaera sp.]
MFYKFSQVVYLLCLSQIFLGSSFLISTKAIANSLETDINQPSIPSFIKSQYDFTHDDIIDQLKSVTQEIEIDEINKSDTTCLSFIPLSNTIEPNLSLNKQEKVTKKVEPTSSCAADLLGVDMPQYSFETIEESSLTVQKDLHEDLGNFADNYTTETNNNDGWHFKLQPYVTVPMALL